MGKNLDGDAGRSDRSGELQDATGLMILEDFSQNQSVVGEDAV